MVEILVVIQEEEQGVTLITLFFLCSDAKKRNKIVSRLQSPEK